MPFGRMIIRAAIHPAIGVARVGNSPTEYFIGLRKSDFEGRQSLEKAVESAV